MVFLPKRYSTKPALVVELKYGQPAESAIAQIKDRQYPEILKDYQGKVLLAAIRQLDFATIREKGAYLQRSSCR